MPVMRKTRGGAPFLPSGGDQAGLATEAAAASSAWILAFGHRRLRDINYEQIEMR